MNSTPRSRRRRVNDPMSAIDGWLRTVQFSKPGIPELVTISIVEATQHGLRQRQIVEREIDSARVEQRRVQAGDTFPSSRGSRPEALALGGLLTRFADTHTKELNQASKRCKPQSNTWRSTMS